MADFYDIRLWGNSAQANFSVLFWQYTIQIISYVYEFTPLITPPLYVLENVL